MILRFKSLTRLEDKVKLKLMDKQEITIDDKEALFTNLEIGSMVLAGKKVGNITEIRFSEHTILYKILFDDGTEEVLNEDKFRKAL